MLKKIGLPTLFLAGMLMLLSPSPANSKVRFGVAVGGPVYTYPAYPYSYSYVDPYSYTYTNPYVYQYVDPYYAQPYYAYPAYRYRAPVYVYPRRDHKYEKWLEHRRHQLREQYEHDRRR